MSDGHVVLPPMTIHERMVAILGELPAIGKDAFNQQQSFHYRSHDDVLNALNPLLAKWGVGIVPNVLDRVTSERKTRSGGTMYEVNLHVQYTFYGLAGDYIIASAWGEGTDSGDKSTNKAMTMAFKNVLAQAFAVSTADTIDSDSSSPEETTGRQAPVQLRELEQLIEAVKEADNDPAHGGNYYYQVAVNAAVKYHGKALEDLAPGEVRDLENRFKGLLKDLTMPVAGPEGGSTELPVEETLVREEGPQISFPASWAEIESSIRTYGDETWVHFYAFLDQAKEHLFPGVQRMSAQRKAVLFQKASSVMIALLETHDPELFPPPARVEFQAHWSKVLDGTVLPGPDYAMDSTEAATRPPREPAAAAEPTTAEAGSGEGDASPASEAAPRPTPQEPPASPEQTFTDAPLTDAEQEALDAVGQEFPTATEVPTTEADAAALANAPTVEVGEQRDS